MHNFFHKDITIIIFIEHVKKCVMLRQMSESTLRQSLHVHLASDTQKIQSSD